MASFAAAIAALGTGRVRTDKIISHRFSLDDYGNALETLTSDPTAHKVVIVVAGPQEGTRRSGDDWVWQGSATSWQIW
jgi:hypothetical protein